MFVTIIIFCVKIDAIGNFARLLTAVGPLGAGSINWPNRNWKKKSHNETTKKADKLTIERDEPIFADACVPFRASVQ